MNRKPTYEELEQRVKELENEVAHCKRADQGLPQKQEKHPLSEDLLSKIFFLSLIPTAITTISDGNVLNINEAFERLTGYKEDEIKGQSLVKLNVWADPEERRWVVNELLEKGSVRNKEVKVRTKSGDICLCLFAAEIIEFDGKPHVLSMAIDHMERKRAEEALRESEARYREIASSIPGVVYQFLLKKDGSYSSPYVSDTVSTILDISAEEIMANADSLFNMIVEEDLDSVNRSIAESAQTMKTWLQEFRIRDRAGNIRWIRATSTPHLLPDGEILWNGVLIDISDRVRAEEALQRAHNGLERRIEERTAELAKANEGLKAEIIERERTEEELQRILKELRALESIINRSPAMVFLWPVQEGWPVEFVSDNVKQILGYRAEDFKLGKVTWPSITHHEDVPRLEAEIAKYLEEGITEFNQEYRLITKSGDVRWMRDRNKVLLDSKGAATHIQSIVLDVTERKQAEEALEESYDIINRSPAVVFLWKNEKGWPVEIVSENVKEIFGYTAEKFIAGKIDYEATVHPDDLDRVAGEVASYSEERGRKEFTHEPYRIVAKDGKVRWLDDRTYIRRNEKGEITHYQGIVLDITERHHLEAQLVQAQKMEAVGTLAGGIAHDFNNLLQSVHGYADMLLFDKKEGDPGYRELQEIVKASRRGSELTQQLLTYSLKVESKLRPVDLNFEVDKIRKLLSRTIPKMIDIEARLGKDLRAVNGDSAQIEQILVNLALNAKDAMPEGGNLIIQTENVTVDDANCRELLVSKPGEYVVLSVSDTGCGMDKATSDRIFDPFFTTKGLAKGTGLGLAMVYGIVKNHGGHISCSSEIGMGTTFRIYLPTIERQAVVQEKRDPEVFKGGTETILLVDDEDFIRELGQETLSRFGYTVLTAVDGETALKLYREKKGQIDLVILDLIMPGMSGKSVLEALLNLDLEAKVIVASGYSDIGPMRESHEAGAKSFIAKPYEVKQLLQMIREVLDQE